MLILNCDQCNNRIRPSEPVTARNNKALCTNCANGTIPSAIVSKVNKEGCLPCAIYAHSLGKNASHPSFATKIGWISSPTHTLTTENTYDDLIKQTLEPCPSITAVTVHVHETMTPEDISFTSTLKPYVLARNLAFHILKEIR